MSGQDESQSAHTYALDPSNSPQQCNPQPPSAQHDFCFKAMVKLPHPHLHPQVTLESLPDEVLGQIVRLIGTRFYTTADPFMTGWNDEAEVCKEVRDNQAAVKPLRLVCRRFLLLSAPCFFRRLVVGDRHGLNQSGHSIVRLAQLLGTKPACCPIAKPYGHHVRKLIVTSYNQDPAWVARLLGAIHELVPHLTELCGLNLSQLPPVLLSPFLSFPCLETLGELDLGLPARGWFLGRQLESVPSHALAPSSNFISREVFFCFLNHHPGVKKLACRGIHLDSLSATRLVALLRSSQLAVPLLSSFCGAKSFSGLIDLHLGHHSVVDLQFLRLLPALSRLQRLHIDADCHLVDQGGAREDDWSLVDLLRSLPRLTHLSFIGQQMLPHRHNSTDWACLDQVLKVAPQLQYLNMRSDSLHGWTIFESLGTTPLCQWNVWHEPIVNSSHEEAWSIVTFSTPHWLQTLGKVGGSLAQAGLEWPQSESVKRDLWLKLKFLIQLIRPDGQGRGNQPLALPASPNESNPNDFSV